MTILALAALPAPDPQLAPLLWMVAAVLVVVGIAGTVVPTLPGSPLVFLGLLVAAWANDFQKVGWVTLTLLGLLASISFGVDIWAARHGARRVGASRLALVGGLVGSVVGFFFSIPGLILGPFLGAFLGELIARRDLRGAGRAGLATWLGMLLAAVGHLAVVFVMLGLFATVYLFHL
jgi:uncharacterized protein YqgC (DUF456 family)